MVPSPLSCTHHWMRGDRRGFLPKSRESDARALLHLRKPEIFLRIPGSDGERSQRPVRGRMRILGGSSGNLPGTEGDNKVD